jgi:hypothetical protein
MSVADGWPFLVAAVVAVAIAIAAGANLAIAVPASAGALFAVAAFLALAVRARTADAPPSAPEAPPLDPARVELALTSGALGRREVVELLDRLEREGPNPMLPGRPMPEVARIADLPALEFDRYVRARVEALEKAT